MSNDSYEDLFEPREEKRRADALAVLRALRGKVRARNASMGADEAEALADRVSREIVDDVAESKAATFERDAR